MLRWWTIGRRLRARRFNAASTSVISRIETPQTAATMSAARKGQSTGSCQAA